MFLMKVAGADAFDLPKECLRNVKFSTDIPLDSDARTADVSTTLTVIGRILTAVDGDPFDSTRKMALWSAIPATKAECYRDVTVQNIRGSIMEREYKFPNAFIVDYVESFGDEEGVGTFVLKLKQKKDKFEDVKIEGGFASED